MIKNVRWKYNVLLLVCLIGLVIQWAGAKAQEENLLDATKGIVKIEVSYKDENDNRYLIREGTGFLVGESVDSQSVIACKSLVEVSNKELKEIRKKHSIKKDEKLNKTIEVVAASDVTVEADVRIKSNDFNCVVLSLVSPLYDRAGLKLGNNENLQKEQSIYVLEMKEKSQTVRTFTGKIMEIGKPVEGISYIEHTAKGESDYFGGPLLNQAGTVIGFNTGVSEEGNALAVSVVDLRGILDAMGISYENAESLYGPLGEALDNAHKIMQNTKKYTKNSMAGFEDTVKEVQSVYENIDATEEQYEGAIQSLHDAQAKLETMEKKMIPWEIALGVAIVLIFTGDLILWIKVRKKKPSMKFMYEEEKEAPMDFEGTVALEKAVNIPHACLVGRSGKIAVNKLVFRLGKAAEQVDYVIPDNKSISRHHADIVCENGFFFIIDRHSLNHTAVNGEILVPDKKKAIRNMDRVRLSNEEYIFEIRG